MYLCTRKTSKRGKTKQTVKIFGSESKGGRWVQQGDFYTKMKRQTKKSAKNRGAQIGMGYLGMMSRGKKMKKEAPPLVAQAFATKGWGG